MAKGKKVSECMSRDVRITAPDRPIRVEDVARNMGEIQVRRLPEGISRAGGQHSQSASR